MIKLRQTHECVCRSDRIYQYAFILFAKARSRELEPKITLTRVM